MQSSARDFTNFPPSVAAATARLRAVRPSEYARTRNALDGAVTRLSPYLTHGLLPLAEVIDDLRSRFGLDLRHKLIQEFGWRAYFHHVWRHLGDRIFESLHAGPLPDDIYSRSLPPDIAAGATGVPVIDQAVRALYRDGYLHNHVRMWLASYVVHMRKVHWRAGADWMYGHLLDGDLASNHLSWQWIAGTASRKPYLFNAENVARYAPPDWHSPGSVIDTDYTTLDRRAHSADFAAASGEGQASVEVPDLFNVPPSGAPFSRPDVADVAGRKVWLVHPWSLGEPPSDALVVAVLDIDFHRRWPWSELRWTWVTQRMSTLTAVRWIGRPEELASALEAAKTVEGWSDPHEPWLSALPGIKPQQPAFVEPERHCQSFSAWFSRLRGFASELPGTPVQASLFDPDR